MGFVIGKINRFSKWCVPFVGFLLSNAAFSQSGSVTLLGKMIAPFSSIDEIKLHADGRSLAVLGESLVIDFDTTTLKQSWKSSIYPDIERLYGEGSINIAPVANALIHGFMTNGGKDACVRIVDLTTGKNLLFTETMPNNDGPFTTMSLSDDKRLALTGAWIGQQGIKLWDMQTGKILKTFGSNLKSVAVNFSPQKQFAYEIHTEGVSVFSLVNYQMVKRVTMRDLFGPRYQSCGPNDCGPATRQVVGAQFLASMRYAVIHTSTDLYVADETDESEIFLVDLESGNVLWKLEMGRNNFPRSILIDEIKNKVAVIASDSYFKTGPSRIEVYNLLNGTLISQIAGPRVWTLANTRTPLRPSALLSFDSKSGILASGSRGGGIDLYKIEF